MLVFSYPSVHFLRGLEDCFGTALWLVFCQFWNNLPKPVHIIYKKYDMLCCKEAYLDLHVLGEDVFLDLYVLGDDAFLIYMF